MSALLALYWHTILAAMCMSGALAIAGAFLLTRQAGVQTLAMSQGAGFGVSLGLLFSLLVAPDQHLEHTAFPLLLGVVASTLSFVLTEGLARRSHSPTGIYLASFALLWGCSQSLIGFFPVVESHATALYFGDVVTLTRGESFFFVALGGAALGYLTLSRKQQSERAFVGSILEEPFRFSHPVDLGFYCCTLLLLCASVQMLGLLFTLSALFLPTAIFTYSARVGAGEHLLKTTLSAVLAAGTGFFLSLWEPRLLTTPTITLCLAAFAALGLTAERLFFRCK